MVLAELKCLGGNWQIRRNGFWAGTISFEKLQAIVGGDAHVRTTSCEYQVIDGRDDYTWGFYANGKREPIKNV